MYVGPMRYQSTAGSIFFMEGETSRAWRHHNNSSQAKSLVHHSGYDFTNDSTSSPEAILREGYFYHEGYFSHKLAPRHLLKIAVYSAVLLQKVRWSPRMQMIASTIQQNTLILLRLRAMLPPKDGWALLAASDQHAVRLTKLRLKLHPCRELQGCQRSRHIYAGYKFQGIVGHACGT